MAKRLTAFDIRNLKPRTKRYEVPDLGARGLYVVVQPSGKKTFAVRYRLNGEPKKLTLGTLGALTLAEAHVAAAKVYTEIEKGRDPNAAKRQAKQAKAIAAANTFKAVAEEYMKREGGRLRSADWRRAVLERLVYATIGDRPIGEIKRSEIIRLLDRIEEGELVNDGKPLKGGATMADRTLAVIRKIMNWHATRSDEFRSPIVRGMARVRPSETARSRILSNDELRAVWKAASERDGPFPALVRFLLLTGARRTEAAAMTWAEIDGIEWTLPASRNKAKVDLVRPLSKAAQTVIEAQPRIEGCSYVFTTGGKAPISGFSKMKERVDAASGVTGWTLHDLRRTARSLMSRAGVPSDHAERCLGHVIGGVRGVYDRHEYHAEKAHAFEALAGQIERIVYPAPPSIVSIRG
jgi:integrase